MSRSFATPPERSIVVPVRLARPAFGEMAMARGAGRVKVTYIGHATLLIEMFGTRILTDPNFERRLAHVLPRVAPPGIALEELPKLDALLLTHGHADHLSFVSLDRLARGIPIFAPPAITRWLQRRGYKDATPVRSGETMTVGSMTVTAAPARHRGNRYAVDWWRRESNMYLLEARKESCFFAGDTALTSETHTLVADRLWKNGKELDTALLPIGYAPWWKVGFRRGHLTYRDALTLFERLRARTLIPYHWGTFRHVTASAYDAIVRLRVLLETHPLKSRVKILEPGESIVLGERSTTRQPGSDDSG